MKLTIGEKEQEFIEIKVCNKKYFTYEFNEDFITTKILFKNCYIFSIFK